MIIRKQNFNLPFYQLNFFPFLFFCVLCTSILFLYLLNRIKVWDLSQETVVTTYNGKRTSKNPFHQKKKKNSIAS